MQAMWRGVISFGLVSIPVRMFVAQQDKTLRFNQLHKEDMGRVRNSRTCSVCGKADLSQDDIVRGYEYEKGRYVTVEDEEIEAASVPSTRTIDVASFVPADQIDPIFYRRAYYIAPDELGAKPYGLLREALRGSGRVAIAKVTFGDRERLVTLRVKDDLIVLETMYWPDEIRKADLPEATQEIPVREQELQMALSLVESLTQDFDLEAFEDEFRKALLKVIAAKVAGEEIVVPETAEAEPPATADLMAALERSLKMVKERREKREKPEKPQKPEK